MPSMGFCLLVAYGWHCFHQRVSSIQRRGLFRRFLRLAPVASFAVLCLLFGAKTITRNWDWADEYSIFSAGLRYGILLVFIVFFKLTCETQGVKFFVEGLRKFSRKNLKKDVKTVGRFEPRKPEIIRRLI